MVERIDGGGVNLPRRVETPRKEKLEKLSSQEVKGFELAQEVAFSDVANVAEELRSRLTAVSEEMDSALGRLSRYQTANQSFEGITSILDSIQELKNEYAPDSIPTEADARFEEMAAELKSTVAATTFENQPLLTPGEALTRVMNADSLKYAWPHVETATAEVGAFGRETLDKLQAVSTEVAEAQVAYENLVSASTPVNVSDVANILATDEVSVTFEGINLNRSNIIQILGT